MIKKVPKKLYIILGLILILLITAKILKYYKIPRYKAIPNVKLQTFSLEKQWEHIKKTVPINGDVRIHCLSLDFSNDNKEPNLSLYLYEKSKFSPLQEIRLHPYEDMIDITISPLRKASINLEEYISMDDFTKILDKVKENINTIFKTPGEKYSLSFFGKVHDYNKINSSNSIPMRTYYIDKKKNHIRILKKEDLPMHNTISILCTRPLEVYPFEERVDVVIDNVH